MPNLPTFNFNIRIGSAILLTLMAVSPSSAATPQPANYGKVVSKLFDSKLSVTEVHLANGLTILLKEDHAAPVAYFSVAYKVGSRYERTGQTGLSHILEHMMFKGTKDLPPGSIDHLFARNGGQINAQTGQDDTVYHELVASDRLELAIRVEADRMENSLFDPTQLKHEMVVVRSELEGDDNDPGFELETKAFLPAAFVAHPYHWPVIGWLPDVEAVANNRAMIYQYYKQHYMPNNAVVVAVGDFDTAKTIALCQKYFGVYPAGKLETHFITPEPEQHGARSVVLKRHGTTTQILIGFHEPGLGTQDHYVMDVISQILSGGRAERLYQSLVETGLAESASAYDQDTKDPYLFIFDAQARSGVTADALEQGIYGEIKKLQSTPVNADELKRAFKQIDSQFVYENDSVSEQASQLASYETILSYHYLDNYLDRIHAVTPKEIQMVAAKYFIPDNRTVAVFDPQPLPPGTAPPPPPVVDNFGAVSAVTSPQQQAMLAKLDKKFNDSNQTSVIARKLPLHVTLPNGLVVIVQENHSNKTVSVSGFLRAGSLFDPVGKWGVSSITAAMLERGTDTKTALQLAQNLDAVGAGLSIGSSVEETSFDGASLSNDLPLVLNTLADELQHPSFPESELTKLKAQIQSGLERSREDTGGTSGAGTQASIAFSQAIYPKNHPFWEPSIDQSETAAASITSADLRAFYTKYYRPDTTAIVVVGDVDAKKVVDIIARDFQGWTKPSFAPTPVEIPDVPASKPAVTRLMIPLADASQTSILWGYSGQLKRMSPDFYAAYVMNYILGGDTFGSRLGRVIRDQSGLAYTVYSGFDASLGAGPFEVFIGSNPSNAEHAVSELQSIIKQVLVSGVSQDEVTQAKEYLTGSYPLRLETNAGVAGQLAVAEEYGLGMDYLSKRSGYFNAVTKAEVDKTIKRYIHPEDAILVLAGAVPVR